jgi:multisubunit Na+/H+ antiporter MnhB subunit
MTSQAPSCIARGAVAALSLALAAVIGAAVLALPGQAPGLREPVAARLAASGVSHPVTAVLMNFRGYDTMLELAVLVVAVLGARALVAVHRAARELGPPLESPFLDALLRLAAPLVVVISGYLLWVGGKAPGGAFQAGALLAALGILLLLAGHDWPRLLTDWAERAILVGGMAMFLLAGIAALPAGSRFLEFPRAGTKWFILAIEAASTLSIGIVLAALFAGGRLSPRQRPQPFPAPPEVSDSPAGPA